VRILIDYRPALRHRTGVGEYVHELASALIRLPLDAAETLTLFSSSWKDRLAADVIPGAMTIDRHIPVRLLNLAWHRLNWPPVERVAGRTFDVVQSAHPLPIPSRTAARIVMVHDLDFLDHPERTRREIRRDYPALTPRAVLNADHVLVNSTHTGLDVERRLGVPSNRITVCAPGAPAWPRRTEEPPAPVLLFFGTLEPRKNIDILLDAYGTLLGGGGLVPNLVLAGATPPEAAPLLARAGAPPLAGHVEVLGYVDPDLRIDLYRRALLLVMPSHAEGFGIPALEAMTLGVPVVAANRGALPEVVGEAGLLIDPDDAGALAHVLGRVIADRPLRDRLRDAGWRQAQRFQWSHSAARARAAWALAVEHRRRRT
jgi:glycosyltransferase involved in cell wall biosynthesis